MKSRLTIVIVGLGIGLVGLALIGAIVVSLVGGLGMGCNAVGC